MANKAHAFALMVLLSRVRTPRLENEVSAVSGSGVEPDGDTHDFGIVTDESEAATVAANVESETSHRWVK